MMIKFIVSPGSWFSESRSVYQAAEYSLDAEVHPSGCVTSILVNDVGLEVDEEGRVIYVAGLCPHTSWRPTKALPGVSERGALSVSIGKPLLPGVSLRLTDSNSRWPVYLNAEAGWVCTTITPFGSNVPGSGEGLTGPIELVYSADGNLASESRPGGWKRDYVGYDASMRLTKLQTSLGDSYKYYRNALGQVLGMTINEGAAGSDPLYQGQWRDYQPNGELETVSDTHGTTTFGYDPATGHLDTLTYPAGGGSDTYDYHDNGWLRSITHSDSLQKMFGYDHGGFLASVEETRAGGAFKSVAYGRDAAGRVNSEATSAGRYHEADYYGDGTLARIDAIHYVRDTATGRLDKIEVKPTQARDGSTFNPPWLAGSMYYTYDDYGQPQSRYSDDGFSETYGRYDNAALHTVRRPIEIDASTSLWM